MGSPPVRICFVCLGNICRSPTAAAVMAHRAEEAGLADRFRIESAGTSGWHEGEGPDRRATEEAREHGVRLTHRARRFRPEDFDRFDMILAMDQENLGDLLALAPDDETRAKVELLRRYDPSGGVDLAVPDPYYGGVDGFATTFDLIDAACRGLLAHLVAGTG
jgi:protein-tyrosine phosphatase